MTLGEEFPLEQARLRELLIQYKELGPVGSFGAAMIEACLKRADKALIEGDLISMIKLFEEMKKFE